MPSFEFADCPTRVELTAATAGNPQQSGSVSCTVRNVSTRRQTARISVEPLGDARPDWFVLAGAPATSPLEVEQDIDAGGTLAAQVTVRIPPKSLAGRHTFRLRATSEKSPDTDFAEGPTIALDVAAAPEPPVMKKKPPLVLWAIAAALVLIAGGALLYFVWPRGLDPALVVGKPAAEATAIAAREGYPAIPAVPGQAAGNDPAKRIVVGVGTDASGRTALLFDPGVPVPGDLVGKKAVDAARTLIAVGIVPTQSPSPSRSTQFADGVVTSTVPRPPAAVALGGSVALVVNDRPDGAGPTGPCLTNFKKCIGLRESQVLDTRILSNDFQRRLEHLR